MTGYYDFAQMQAFLSSLSGPQKQSLMQTVLCKQGRARTDGNSRVHHNDHIARSTMKGAQVSAKPERATARRAFWTCQQRVRLRVGLVAAAPWGWMTGKSFKGRLLVSTAYSLVSLGSCQCGCLRSDWGSKMVSRQIEAVRGEVGCHFDDCPRL